MLPTSTVSWSRLFHLFTTVCEKKYLLTSLTLCYFFNLNVCPLVPLIFASLSNNSSILSLVNPLYILNTSGGQPVRQGRGRRDPAEPRAGHEEGDAAPAADQREPLRLLPVASQEQPPRRALLLTGLLRAA